jgi:hypothetical protein
MIEHMDAVVHPKQDSHDGMLLLWAPGQGYYNDSYVQ